MEEDLSNLKRNKEERFKRIAARRVQEILDKMRLLRNCSNTNNYSYNQEQVNKIVQAIDSEWKRVKNDFQKHKPKKKVFKLD